MNKLLISFFCVFFSWPEQLGAEDSAGRRWRADGRGSSRRERVGADGAAQRQHHGDGLPITGALQRRSSHPWLHRCINTPPILLLDPIASFFVFFPDREQLDFVPFCIAYSNRNIWYCSLEKSAVHLKCLYILLLLFSFSTWLDILTGQRKTHFTLVRIKYLSCFHFPPPGFPNVGKSSVINSLVGRKVVSVSRTPGHTKYFQTYYLTQTVKLCDCPGLVFPSRVDKQLQVHASFCGFCSVCTLKLT